MLHERRYAITFLLYGAACPSPVPSLTMGEIDSLVSKINLRVFLFFSQVRKVLVLASRAIILV